jgi:hypothetical protein
MSQSIVFTCPYKQELGSGSNKNQASATVGLVSSAPHNSCIPMIRATISPVPEDLPGDINAVQVRKGNAKTTGVEIQGVLCAGHNENTGGMHDTQLTRHQNPKKG